ncbi:Hypothetical protein A7982_08533 [Minicystis rosea]|nr:Hypothetical protein A7982_08533 [Minicystis rosea]
MKRLHWAFGSVLAMLLSLGCGGSGANGTGATTTASAHGGTGGSAGGNTGTAGATGVGGSMVCPACGKPEATGALSDGALKEVSGVVASLAHPGVFWVHNDSGDSARFFAVDEHGTRLATITVAGAQAIDWEDIARGPCPSGTCIYLADIGDNQEKRTSYTIYRVPEPATVADATVTAEALPFTYPDGSHNAETLLVHPTTGAVTVVTKVYIGESSIFEMPLPLTPGTTAVMKDAGGVKPPEGSVLFTGGDVHPSGKGVILRTYSELWYYPIAQNGTVASALAGAPCAMPVASEEQGEAVGFLADGKGYVTISEGAGSKVNKAVCSGL